MSPDVFPHGETHNVPVMASQAVWPRVTANKSASYGTFFFFFSLVEKLLLKNSLKPMNAARFESRTIGPSRGKSESKEWRGLD